jgi:hypothetical protein
MRKRKDSSVSASIWTHESTRDGSNGDANEGKWTNSSVCWSLLEDCTTSAHRIWIARGRPGLSIAGCSKQRCNRNKHSSKRVERSLMNQTHSRPHEFESFSPKSKLNDVRRCGQDNTNPNEG